MRSLTALIAFFACSAFCSSAELAKAEVKHGHDIESLSKARVSPVTAALSYANWTYYTSVTVPANSYTYLDTNIDFSSSTEISVSVLSANADVGSLSIAPYWTSNGVPYFMPSTSVSGSTFPFNDSGAAYFTVSGTQLRVFLYNRSSAAMTYKAVYIYANTL